MRSQDYDSVNRVIEYIFSSFHANQDEILETLAKKFFRAQEWEAEFYVRKKLPWARGQSRIQKMRAPIDPDSKENREWAIRGWVYSHAGLDSDAQVSEFRESIAAGAPLEPYLNRIRASLAVPVPLTAGRPRGRVDSEKKTPITETGELTPCVLNLKK